MSLKPSKSTTYMKTSQITLPILLIFLLFLTLFSLLSCGERDKMVQKLQKKVDSLKNEVSMKKMPSKEELMKDSIAEYNDFTTRMKQKKFSFFRYNDCGGFPDTGELDKYKKGDYFYISKQIIGDSTQIKFSFIENCCHNFLGNIERKQDTLKLTYNHQKGGMSCTCSCVHNYQFSLPTKLYQSKYILLGDTLLTNP